MDENPPKYAVGPMGSRYMPPPVGYPNVQYTNEPVQQMQYYPPQVGLVTTSTYSRF